MAKNKIIVLSQHNDAVKLYCNCFNSGTKIIEYFSEFEPAEKLIKKIDSEEVWIEGLRRGRYFFRALKDANSDAFIVNIKTETKKDYFSSILDNYNDEDVQAIIKQIKTNDYLEELYKKYRSKDAGQYDDLYRKILRAVIDRENKYSNITNWVWYNDFDVNVTNTDSLAIKVNSIYENANLRMLEYSWDAESNGWEEVEPYNGIRGIIFSKVSSDGNLHRYDIYYGDDLVRRVYNLAPDEKEYAKLFEYYCDYAQQKALFGNSLDNLVDVDHEYDSEDEKEILKHMDYASDCNALLPCPKLAYEDEVLFLDTSDYYALIQNTGRDYYLCGKEYDSLYDENIKAHKVKITAAQIFFSPRVEYYFNNERYYFWLENDNGVKISAITTIDLTEKDNKDYTQKYYDIWLQRLLTLFFNFLKNRNYGEEITSAAHEIVNSYLRLEDNKYINFFNYFIQNAARPEYIDSLLQFRLMYYTAKDRTYTQERTHYLAQRKHVVPEGEYILELIRSNPARDKFTVEYLYDPQRVHEIYYLNIDENIVARCINVNNFKVSDPVLMTYYRNGKTYINNYGLKVDVINGQ